MVFEFVGDLVVEKDHYSLRANLPSPLYNNDATQTQAATDTNHPAPASLPPTAILLTARPLETYTTLLPLKSPTSSLSTIDALLRSPHPPLTTNIDLQQVLTWKLHRGKFRASLPKLLDSNEGEMVERVLREAKVLVEGKLGVEEALDSGAVEKMCELKGVGPATASAFLSFLPNSPLPFFSDEATSFFPLLKPIKYTLPFYKTFARAMAATVETLNQEPQFADEERWDVGELERVLWCVAVARKLGRLDLVGEEAEAEDVPAEKEAQTKEKKGKRGRAAPKQADEQEKPNKRTRR